MLFVQLFQLNIYAFSLILSSSYFYSDRLYLFDQFSVLLYGTLILFSNLDFIEFDCF